MIHLYDGLNVIRRRLELDPMGRAPRSLVTSMLTPAKGDVHVWAFEGSRSLSKRREIFPGYKVREDSTPSGFFALVDLIREAFQHTHAIQIDVDGYEADDVIARVVMDNFNRSEIHIHSTDRDLNQLLRLPNVTTDVKPQVGVDPAYVRLYKTFKGDSSDKIPGLAGFGEKSWGGADKPLLQRAFLKPTRTVDDYIAADLSPRLAAKAIEDHKILEDFWTIVGFLEVTEDINTYMKPGTPDPDKADAILKRFYH